MKKSHQLSEFTFFDGEANITFNLIDIDTAKKEITVAVTNRGRISVLTFDILEDEGRLYFEYGAMYDKIDIEDFEEVDD